jgi:hypothetical protein
MYHFLLLEITKEEFQKTQEKIFGSYKKKEEFQVSSQKIADYVKFHSTEIINSFLTFNFFGKDSKSKI